MQMLAACQAVALGEYNALEPAWKGFWLAQLAQVAPGDNKSILGGILCHVEITQHRIGTGKSHILKAAHNLSKGLMLLRSRAARRRRPVDQLDKLIGCASHIGKTACLSC
jgi:hypothetical protein